MKKGILLIAFLFLVSLIIRLDAIDGRTVFLGDQGVIVSELRDALRQGKLPDTGQTHSNGIRLGPVMYYLFAIPYIASGNNPLGIAVFIAFLNAASVVLLYITGEKMFGGKPAYVVSFLYAVSPVLWHQMPNIWPPALVPFFVLLLFYGMILVREREKPVFVIIAGIAFGVLSQLYAPTFPAVYALAFFAVVVLFRIRFRWIGVFLFSAAVMWLPYIVFEIGRQFEDLRTSLSIMLFPPAPSSALASTLADSVGLLRSVFDKLVPFGDIRIRSLVAGLMLINAVLFGGLWGRVIVFWFAVASLPLLLYKGPVHEHYVVSFFVIPFFCLGFILATLRRFWPRLAVILPVVLFLYLFANRQVTLADNDLTRTEGIVDEMIRQSQGSDFSFTLLRSPSFSDYHFRYFLEVKGVSPRVIFEDDYPILFLVCEKTHCPSWSELEKQRVIHVSCYEKLCKAMYPDKRLAGWRYKSEKEIFGSRITTLSLEK